MERKRKRSHSADSHISLKTTALATQPVTKANLQILGGAVELKVGDSSSEDHSTSVLESTMSKASKLSTPRVREILQAHQISIEDGDALKRSPKAFDAAKAIIQGYRNSSMQPGSQEKFITARELYEMYNESTFVARLWKLLLRDTREKKTLQEKGANASWALEPWDNDHLDFILNKDFNPGCLPLPELHDPTLAEVLKQFPRLKNPKPDMTYGLSRLAFSKEEQFVNIRLSNLTQLAHPLLHAFVIIECKGHGGSLQEAETQACGGGAAIVQAVRKLHAEAGLDILSLGADDQSFVFSLAFEPEVAKFFVHWAEVTSGVAGNDTVEVTYHMNRIASYVSDQEEHVKNLRHDIDNILDWGTLERKTKIKTMLAKIKSECDTKLAPKAVTPSKRKASQNS